MVAEDVLEPEPVPVDVLVDVTVEDDKVDVAGGFADPVPVANVVFDEPHMGFEGAARAEEARMAAAVIVVKSILMIIGWSKKKASQKE